ncbi:MAG: hypothetical protein B7Z52_05790, partial [Burkholderiales bacterium 12-64-5]
MVPHTATVSFQLEEGADNLDLRKGLLLDGGQDLAGNALNYALDQSLLANHGTFSDLRWCVPSSEGSSTATGRVVYDAANGPREWPAGGVKLFGADAQQDTPIETGRVVSSPALAMTGGPREITVTFAGPVQPARVIGAVSGEFGWMPLAGSSATNETTDLEFTLSQTAGPIVPPHGLDNYFDAAPLLKLTSTDGQELPVVKTVSTFVEAVAELEVYTEAGEQDPTSTFLPFGQIPVVGVGIDLAAREFYDHPNAIELQVIFNWIGLPTVSFPTCRTGIGTPSIRMRLLMGLLPSMRSIRQSRGDPNDRSVQISSDRRNSLVAALA